MSEVRFYTDEHIAVAVAGGLRQRGVDVVTVSEAGMRGRSDEEQLGFAFSQRRVLVTKDGDFLTLAAQGHLHAGIAFVRPKASAGHMIRGLVLIHQILSAEDMDAHIEFI